ncbi:hypothetical protein F0U44_12630 [Nocardioides humilatus]|uniref:Fibronectin type-III domain-containing protein n=1 Tax=Nocardioides humilatus TaxID=2607660 RepID=A0A5B1LF39_9ACTN|nr:hypothetical protein [Nocardioides humilatus]KAA1419285.1 hypothetical protein F0U44_12630 [Nocardioides humilatus]
MRSRWVTFVVVSVLAVAPALGIPATARADGVPVLAVTDVTGIGLTVSAGGGTQTIQATCPTGTIPLSGYVTASATDDLRRLFETFQMVDGGTFLTSIVNFGAQNRTVQAVVRCVATSQLGTIHTASGTFDAAADHVAEGTVACGDGWVAINASVTEPHSPDRTLLTSTPTADLAGWSARGWVGDPDDPTEVMTIDAHCVQKTRLPGIQAASHYDSVGWGAAAAADCPTGLFPLYGGTTHIDGDRGGISVLEHPTSTGWASTTLSLSSGYMFSTVACVPSALPTLFLSGSTGYTNVAQLYWTWTAFDPASAGGYSMGFVCQINHPGTGTLPHSCSAPITQTTGVADGEHSIEVYAQTSDGRRSALAQATVVVDTVPPIVYVTAPPLFPATRAATVTWSGTDATAGIAGYELRRRRTPRVGAVGEWTTPVSLPPTATTRGYVDLLEGSTYCFEVRAKDRATNTSPWGQKCAAIPIDDRSLTRSAGWTEVSEPGWLDNSALETTQRGANVYKRATTRRLALTALTCPTCGKVAVLVAGTQVATFDLAAATTRRQLFTVPPFALTTGAVVVKVVSEDKLVKIDSLSSWR